MKDERNMPNFLILYSAKALARLSLAFKGVSQ